MNLVEYCFDKKKELEKPFLFEGNKTKSFAQLYCSVSAIASRLIEERIKQRNIILFADNSSFFIEAYYGIVASGNTVVPIYQKNNKEFIKQIIEKTEPCYMFVQERYIEEINQIWSGKKFTDSLQNESIYSLNGKTEPVKVDAKKEVAAILFTSGSTGIPRGVMLSHHNIMFNTDSIIEYLKLNEKDRFMQILPLSYCFGASWMHCLLRVGGQMVINNSFVFPDKVLQEIKEKECTGFAGVPTTFQIILRRTNIWKMNFPKLRFIAQAGGKLANQFIKELVSAFPNKEIYIMYGQTEGTARLSYLPPELVLKKIGSIGKGIPGTELMVLNAEGKKVKPGEIGEIVVKGENIMLGYYKDPENTSKKIRNGMLFTGDLATVDEDNFIYIVGREDQFIKSRGFRISCEEIENVLYEIPDIVEAAVIGINDELRGEAIAAFVVLKKESNKKETEILEMCRKKLPAYKVPSLIKILEKLPKNESGKILRSQLKNELNK